MVVCFLRVEVCESSLFWFYETFGSAGNLISWGGGSDGSLLCNGFALRVLCFLKLRAAVSEGSLLS